MSQSTQKSRRRKPSKPSKDWPLVAHPNGQWSKQIRGRVFYFGVWELPDAALERYLRQKDALLAGREPQPEGQSVKDLCNLYLQEQEYKLREGNIQKCTFDDCIKHCQFVVSHIGHLDADNIAPSEFTTFLHRFPKTWGVRMREKIIKQTRAVFRFAVEEGLLSRPPAYGSRFKPPSKKDRTKARAKQTRESRIFAPDEIRRILAHCQETGQLQLRAMMLLGINCGFGNSDCGRLREPDIEDGWIRIYRGKTGEERDCPLWAETIQAIQDSVQSRTKQCSGLVFVTKYGNPWAKEGADCPISKAFRKVANTLGIKPSFYSLRHTFQTVCDRCQIPRYVTRQVMGHSGQSISDDYSHGVTDEQLQNAVSAVHAWLFEEGGAS